MSAQSLREELICPVLIEPLFNAVVLIPCAHKIQQEAAVKIFGEISVTVKSSKPCPICRTIITGYMVDHNTRNIVKQIFEIVPKDDIPIILYPGISAKFVHDGGDWELFKSGANRIIQFRSTTANSLITCISILGYSSGDIRIGVNFSDNVSKEIIHNESDHKVVLYFKQYDILLRWIDIQGIYVTKNLEQTKNMYNIIIENNELPASYFVYKKRL